MAQALGVLDDPRTRDLIYEHADDIVDAVHRWVSDHGPAIVELVRGHIGQRGLERRAANVRGAVATLSRKSNVLAESLRPVNGALDEVDQLLTVSKALPLVKRKRAQMGIDDVLDELEWGLFDAARRGPRSSSET